MPTSLRGGVGPPKKKAPPPAPIPERSPVMQPKPPKPSILDKQAAVHAAVHNLPPHVVARPQPSAPISDVAMESRRQQRLRGPFVPPPVPRSTLDTRYKAAIAAPANPKIKVPGLKKRVRAQDYLAATMTPDELAAYANDFARTEATTPAYFNRITNRVTERPGGDGGFLHALTEIPGEAYQHVYGPLLGQLRYTLPSQLGGPPEYKRNQMSFGEALKAPAKNLLIGRSAVNLFTTGHTSDPAGALLELALLPVGGARVLKVGEEVALGLTTARQAGLKRNELVPVIRAAVARGLSSPITGAEVPSQEYTRLIGEAANNPFLQSAARNGAHEAIDTLTQSRLPVETQAIKDALDVQVHLATQGMKPKEAKAYARTAFKEWGQEATAEIHGRVETIKKLINARIEAVRNPHIAPEIPVPPLDEAANAEHVRRAIAESKGVKVDTNPARLNQIFADTYRLAVQGRRFRQWYEVSAKAILALVHGDTKDANILAQLMGIYSASAEVPANSIFALRAFDQWKANMPITEGSLPQIEKATKAVNGQEWEGMKTNSFYGNLAKHILPADQYRAIFKDRPVTVDIWMMRVFGWKGKGKEVPSPRQYEWVANRIREIADQLGWSPEEVQAAAWVAFKAQTEGTSQELAAFDYAHGIQTHVGQINYETMTDQLKGAIPPEAVDQQFQDVMEIIAPGGHDLISEQIGLGAGFHTGPGVENVGGRIVHNPGVASYIPLVRRKGVSPQTLGKFLKAKDFAGAADYADTTEQAIRADIKAGLSVGQIAGKYDKGRGVTISEAERQLAREAAAARGFVLDQRAVGTGRIFQPETLEEANAVDLRIPGGISTDTAERIAAFAGPDTGIIHTPDGAWLVNFGKETNAVWRERMGTILDQVDPNRSARAYRAAYDGELVGRSDYEDLLARLERRRPGTGEVLRRLAGDVRATNQRYFDAGAEWRANRIAALASREGRAAEPTDLLGPAGPRGSLEGDPLQFAAGFPEQRLPPRVVPAETPAEPWVPPEGPHSRDLVDPTPGNRRYEISIGNEVVGSIQRDPAGKWVPTPMGRFVPGSENWVGGEKTLKAAEQRLLTHAYGISPAREDIPGMLHGAKVMQPRAAALRSAEAGARIAPSEEAWLSNPDAIQGFHAAKHELRGEYPRIQYKHFQYFTRDALVDMVKEIRDSESLRYYEKINAAGAVEAAWEKSKLPTPAEIGLLEKVFGKLTTESIAAATEGERISPIVNLLGLPRALQTSFDLSFIARQALVAGARHPNIARQVFAETIPRARTKAGADALAKELETSPTAPLHQKYKLAVTDLGGDWARNEEQYVSRWAEHIPGVGLSSREYTLGLATLRARLFDFLAPEVEQAALEGKGFFQSLGESYRIGGHDLGFSLPRIGSEKRFLGVGSRGVERDVDKSLGDLAGFVNASTGRGNLGSKTLEQAAPLLNQILFSPRLLASRLAFLNPIWYARLDPAVRAQALSSAMHTLFTGMVVLGIAREAGATVGLNPLSSDFGKIKVGNTRIDIWGGFQPIIRYLAQIAKGEYISASTGEKIPLGSGIAKTTRADVWLRFARSKAAPLPGLIWDLGAGKNIQGEDVSLSSWKGRKALIAQEFIPLLWQDMYDYLHTQGVSATKPSTYGRAWNARRLGAAGTILGLGTLGVGALTFKPRAPNRKLISPPSGGLFGGGGSNGLFGGGGSQQGLFGG